MLNAAWVVSTISAPMPRTAFKVGKVRSGWLMMVRHCRTADRDVVRAEGRLADQAAEPDRVETFGPRP